MLTESGEFEALLMLNDIFVWVYVVFSALEVIRV